MDEVDEDEVAFNGLGGVLPSRRKNNEKVPFTPEVSTYILINRH